ncbi:MAG: TetR/AcrR family transcriptional regulator [Weeksellaceae bacterium]
MNRKRIIKEASEMFYAVGFKTLTMDDIANQLSMSKKTLYELFGSKENLIKEVLQYSFEDIQENFSKIQGENLDAVEELILLKQYVDKKYNSAQRQSCLYQLQRYYAKLYQKIFMAEHHKIIARLENNFKKGKEQGLYRETIVPEIYASLYFETQTSLKKYNNFNMNLEKQYEMAEIHADIFIRGILSAEGLKRYEQITTTS